MARNRTIGLLLILGALAAAAAGFYLLRTPAPPSLAESPQAIDILVTHESIYMVTRADLRTFGWQEVDPGDLRIENRGQPYPFYIEMDGADFSLVFYGKQFF